MPNNKINFRDIIFQSLLGFLGYFLFNSFKKPVKLLSLGVSQADVSEYQSIYFKKQEYFKKNEEIPELYNKNWYAMQSILDIIRIPDSGFAIRARKTY